MKHKNTFSFLKKMFSRTSFFVAGIAISLGAGVAFAAFTPVQKNALDPLYASDWNDLMTYVGIWEAQDDGDVILNADGKVGLGKEAGSGFKLDVEGKVRGTELCIGSVCKQNWDPASGWLAAGGDIQTDTNFSGKVIVGSVGMPNGDRLDVLGNIKAEGDVCGKSGTNEFCLSDLGTQNTPFSFDGSGNILTNNVSMSGKVVIGAVGGSGPKLDVVGDIKANNIQASNGYIQLNVLSGIANPLATECDSADELGRMVVNSGTTNLYVCTSNGSGGFQWTVK